MSLFNFYANIFLLNLSFKNLTLQYWYNVPNTFVVNTLNLVSL